MGRREIMDSLGRQLERVQLSSLTGRPIYMAVSQSGIDDPIIPYKARQGSVTASLTGYHLR